MTRIDWIILRRLSARVLLVTGIVFSVFALVASLDLGMLRAVFRAGGPVLVGLAIVAAAARAAVNTLPISVLMGTIVGVLDLQARREMVVIQATGISVWRALRAPIVGALLLGIIAALAVDSAALVVQRSLPVNIGISRASSLWIEQTGKDGAYVLYAEHPSLSGADLGDVTLFFSGGERQRVTAATARLEADQWRLTDGIRYPTTGEPKPFAEATVATVTTLGDLRVRMTSARDLTIPELVQSLRDNVADPELRAAAMTSLLRLVAMPFVLVGAVLVGFAFASGYRRTNKYGGMVLYGIVLGFVVYVVTELAVRSGFAGVVDPAFAAGGPALVAIVIGLTVLLYREDGRAS
ncbi:MAG: LptF/LptG family permease [Devosia sp.]